MNTDLLLILIGLGFLLIIGIIVVCTSIKKNGDKKEANKFLEGLSDRLKSMFLDVVRNFDPDTIDDIINTDIEVIETAILSKIYEVCWDYVKCVVEKKSQEDADFFTQAVLALLQNKSFVEDFIRNLINTGSAQTVIHSKARYIKSSIESERIEECEEREKDLNEEFSDDEKYVTGEEDFQTFGEDVNEPTEEELAELNPQVDEPEELDPENDPSVEIIDEDIYYDRSGRARSKKTGKWVKDPKK